MEQEAQAGRCVRTGAGVSHNDSVPCAQVHVLDSLTNSPTVVLGIMKLGACGCKPPGTLEEYWGPDAKLLGGMGNWVHWLLTGIKEVSCWPQGGGSHA